MDGLPQQDPAATTLVPLTRIEAQALTDRIRETADQLGARLLKAHERHAWRALNYGSWRKYAMAEFNMSQGHAYRLLNHGRVIRELEALSDQLRQKCAELKVALERIGVQAG